MIERMRWLWLVVVAACKPTGPCGDLEDAQWLDDLDADGWRALMVRACVDDTKAFVERMRESHDHACTDAHSDPDLVELEPFPDDAPPPCRRYFEMADALYVHARAREQAETGCLEGQHRTEELAASLGCTVTP